MKEYDQVQSVNISPQDCVQADGLVINVPCEKKCKPTAEGSEIISSPLPKTSKRDSSMKNEESIPLLKRKSTIEYDNADDWEIDLDNRYSEDEIISIINMMSYWINRRNGFGSKNCEETYKEERENDKDNILFGEAMYGFELMGKDDVIKLERPKPRNAKKYIKKT